jgi:LEA14-like dessication related protein
MNKYLKNTLITGTSFLLLCSSAYALVKPTVTVKTYSIDSVGLKNINSTLFLNIDNPNGIGVDLKKVEYKVDINTVKDVAEGMTIKEIKIAKESKENPIEVPVSVLNKKILSTLTSIVKSPEKINYTVTGKVYFATFLGDIPIPFEKSSYVDNTDSIKKIKEQVKSLSLFNLF